MKTLAPKLRTVPVSTKVSTPTAEADIYALGRLGYYILSAGKHHPADAAAPRKLDRDNFAILLPQMDDVERQFPGATDLLASWLVDGQPVADSLNQQYLLRLEASDELGLLDGWQ